MNTSPADRTTEIPRRDSTDRPDKENYEAKTKDCPEKPVRNPPWRYPSGERPEFFDRAGLTWTDRETELFASIFYAAYSKQVPGLSEPESKSRSPRETRPAENPNFLILRSHVANWLSAFSQTDVQTAIQDTCSKVVATVRLHFVTEREGGRTAPLEAYFLYTVLKREVQRWGMRETRRRIPLVSIDDEDGRAQRGNVCVADMGTLPDSLTMKREEGSNRGTHLDRLLTKLKPKQIMEFRTFLRESSILEAQGKPSSYQNMAELREGENWRSLSEQARIRAENRLRKQFQRLKEALTKASQSCNR